MSLTRPALAVYISHQAGIPSPDLGPRTRFGRSPEAQSLDGEGMSDQEQAEQPLTQGQGHGSEDVERGASEEASGAPLTDTEIETSKKPEDRHSDV
jgi:hypothetical protein